MKRKICFIITSPIHYSRNLTILDELKKRRDIELHIILGGTAVLSKYLSKMADMGKMLRDSGFKNIHETFFYLDGHKDISKAKTVGLGIIEFSSTLNTIRPDVVVVRGDRFEVLAAVISATHLNISIAHIEGGDLSGNIDESIRHAITKLSHIHFTTNEFSKRRVIKMGENPEYTFNFGSPDIEAVSKFSRNKVDAEINTGSGYQIDFSKPYIIVMFHPVTTEEKTLIKTTNILLEAIVAMDIQTIWFWPNADNGSEEISHELRKFKDNNPNSKIRFMRYLPPQVFFSILRNTKCLVGNSSAGIKECSYLGIPVVNIGTRQNNRLKAENVVDVDFNKATIIKAIKKQIKLKNYNSSKIYHLKDTGKKIAKVLSTIDLYIQKKFFE